MSGKNDLKQFKTGRYYLQNGNVIINVKKFYDQQIDSDIKQCQQMKKLTVGQGEDYTTEFSLDYDYIKNNFRSITIDLITQK